MGHCVTVLTAGCKRWICGRTSGRRLRNNTSHGDILQWLAVPIIHVLVLGFKLCLSIISYIETALPHSVYSRKKGRMRCAQAESPAFTTHSLSHLPLMCKDTEHPYRCTQIITCAHTLGQKCINTLAYKSKIFVQRATVPPTAQMAVLCCQSYTPKTYTYPLWQRVPSFIILPHNKAQIHVCFLSYS